MGISPKIGFAEPKFSRISELWLGLKQFVPIWAFLASSFIFPE
jgi:hypothetical protein